jgi:hypothetical protein
MSQTYESIIDNALHKRAAPHKGWLSNKWDNFLCLSVFCAIGAAYLIENWELAIVISVALLVIGLISFVSFLFIGILWKIFNRL